MSIVGRNHNTCRTSETFLWCGIWLLLYLVGLLWIYPSVGDLPTFSVASIKLKIIHLHLALITIGLLLVHHQLIKLDNDSSFSRDLFCSDPVESLKQNKKKALYSLLFFILAAHYGFLDVLRYEHTMVSAPYLGLPSHYCQPPFGNGYNTDACAGSLIEGPGIWVTNQYLKHGHLPLWNPYEGCGAPYLANGDTAALSLIQLPLHLFPSLKLWNIYAVSRMVLAGWFASLFFLGVGFSGIPSILGGLAFAFGGTFVLHANLVHLNSALLLPLVLFFTEALLFRASWWRWMGLVLVFGLVLNGGNPQPAVVISSILLFRLLWPTMEKEGWKNWIVKRSLIVSALVSGGILTAPTLLPLAEMLGKSASRGMSGNILPFHLQSFLFFGVPPDLHSISTFGNFFLPPWLYLGTFVLFLFLAGMFFYFTNRNRHVGHLSIWFTLVIIYLFFLHAWVGVFLLSNIPILRGVIWIKYISALNLLIAFFAVFALNTILRCGDKRGYVVASCSVLFLILALCCARFEIASIQLWVIVATSVIVILFMFLPRQSVIYVSLFMPLIVLTELSIYHPDYPLNPRLNCKDFPALPKSISKLLTEKNTRDIAPSRIFALENVLPPLSSSIFKLEDIRTVSPVPLKYYHRWLQMSIIDNGGNAPPYRLPVSRDALLSPILDIAGVRHVLTKQKIHKYFFDGPVRKSPYILWASFMGSIVPESLSIEKLIVVNCHVIYA
ncbi:MAG: hypothetical protein C4B58_03680 [Deltaproteobacteria bacterium]|nr:MAG: hypothetical protein C4B58_03680 [Deltaproteobacteria bacterium]